MNRLAGLDALRGLAALGVLVWHYGGHFGAMPWFDALRPFYVAGLYLVDVFFVLSGFLLGQLYKSNDSLPEFFFKRVTRLFPLHWLTLLVTAFLQLLYSAQAGAPFIYAINDVFHFGLNVLLMQQSGLQQGFSFNGPSWSISAEWGVNLIFMALLFVPARRYQLAAGITVAAFLCLSLGQGRLIGSGALAGWLDFGLLRGAFGFFLGVWLADLLSPSGKLHALCGRFGALTNRLWDALGVLAGCVLLIFMARPDTRLAACAGCGFCGNRRVRSLDGSGLLKRLLADPFMPMAPFALVGGCVLFCLSLALSLADCFCLGQRAGAAV